MLLLSLSCTHAAVNTPAEPIGARVARFPIAASLPRNNGGSASALPVSRPARRSLALRPACSLNRPRRPFFIGVLQRNSLPPCTAPTASGWSDSCRAGFSPAEIQRLSTAHVIRQGITVEYRCEISVRRGCHNVIRSGASGKSPVILFCGTEVQPGCEPRGARSQSPTDRGRARWPRTGCRSFGSRSAERSLTRSRRTPRPCPTPPAHAEVAAVDPQVGRGDERRVVAGQEYAPRPRRVVGPAVRLRDLGRDARHVDDGTAASVADDGRGRVGHRRVGDRPRLQAAQPRLPVGAEPGGDERERVVHQVVQPTPRFGRLPHEPPTEGLLGMVAAARRHLVSLPGEVAQGLLSSSAQLSSGSIPDNATAAPSVIALIPEVLKPIRSSLSDLLRVAFTQPVGQECETNVSREAFRYISGLRMILCVLGNKRRILPPAEAPHSLRRKTARTVLDRSQ